MALADLLKNSGKKEKKIGYSPERIEAVLPVIRQYLGFFRDYPDLFVDFMQDGGHAERPKQLKFYYYQRVNGKKPLSPEMG